MKKNFIREWMRKKKEGRRGTNVRCTRERQTNKSIRISDETSVKMVLDANLIRSFALRELFHRSDNRKAASRSALERSTSYGKFADPSAESWENASSSSWTRGLGSRCARRADSLGVKFDTVERGRWAETECRGGIERLDREESEPVFGSPVRFWTERFSREDLFSVVAGTAANDIIVRRGERKEAQSEQLGYNKEGKGQKLYQTNLGKKKKQEKESNSKTLHAK